MLKVGIVGVGTVGESVVNILQENLEIITARAGVGIVPVKGVVKNLAKKRNVNIPLTDNPDELLDDPDIDVIVELMGGVEGPKAVVEKALANGKDVVTANKALLAYHRYELEAKAEGRFFAYEASTAGGIPIIKALKEGMAANHIRSIRGIMNGTCNYILTKMANEGVGYEETLKEAQELGYAEADPTLDVGGFDAAHKLLILSSIAYGIDAKPEDILIEGIDQVTAEDIEFAKDFDFVIKHLGIAKKMDGKVSLRAHPVLIPKEEMIAKVDGVMNGISVIGDRVGETMYYGPGAGGGPTASAVIADLIDLARGGNGFPMLGFQRSLERGLALASRDEIVCRYYIRLLVDDGVGVLERLASVLADEEISIETMLQRQWGNGDQATLLLTTHETSEARIQKTLAAMEALECVQTKPVMIRIEG